MPHLESLEQIQIEDYFVQTFAKKIAELQNPGSKDILKFVKEFTPRKEEIRVGSLMNIAIRNGLLKTALNLENPLNEILETNLLAGEIDFKRYFEEKRILFYQVAAIKRQLL